MPLRSLTKVFPVVSMQMFIQFGELLEALQKLFNGEFFAQIRDVVHSAGMHNVLAEVMQFATGWGVL